MPYSNPVFDQIVKNFIKRHKFTNYLDIGIGSGKYGKIIKNIFPKAKVFGVEVDKSYNLISKKYMMVFITKK